MKNMKNKIKKYILYISAFVIFIFLAIYGTYQYANSNHNIDKLDFIGTYQMEPSGTTYLTLMVSEDERNNLFYIYNESATVLSEGTYEATDENFAVLRNDNGIVSTIVYNDDSFRMINNFDNTIISISKISDEPIVYE